MKKPIVSIVIPTYSKSESIVGVALKSIVNQTCPKDYYEIIVADNNGTKKVKELAKQYSFEYSLAKAHL